MERNKEKVNPTQNIVTSENQTGGITANNVNFIGNTKLNNVSKTVYEGDKRDKFSLIVKIATIFTIIGSMIAIMNYLNI